MLPDLFLNMFTSVSDVHDYDTRQATKKKLSVPFKSTSRGQQSITYIGPHVWNFILSKINPICSIGSFKRHLRLLLQHCYVSDIKWWSLTFEKKKKWIIKKCSPNQYLHVRICCMCSYVCICMYACVLVYVNVYVCTHKCKHMYFCGTLMYTCIWLINHFVFIIFVWDKHCTVLRQIQCGAIMAGSISVKILTRDKPLLARYSEMWGVFCEFNRCF